MIKSATRLFLGFMAAAAVSAAGIPDTALWALYNNRDMFRLEDALEHLPIDAEPGRIFLWAAAQAGRGHETDSASTVEGLLKRPIDSQLEIRARNLLMLDDRALFHYRAAFAALAPLLESGRADEPMRNRARLLQAIENVLPETVDGTPHLVLSAPRVAVGIAGQFFGFAIDSGANLSVITRDVSRRAHLRVIAVDYSIRTADGKALHADVASADLEIAGALIRHAIVLVVPALAGAGSYGPPIGGLIGMPELRQLGPLQLGLSPRPLTRVTSLALADGDPILELGLGATRLLCRLDSGSNRTTVAASLWQQVGRPSAPRAVSVTGLADRRTRLLHESPITFDIAGRRVTIAEAIVLPPASSGNQPACTLGADALAAVGPVVLDFARLRLLTR